MIDLEAPVLSRSEVERLVGVARATIDRAIQSGDLRVGAEGKRGAQLFSVSAIFGWMRLRVSGGADEDSAKARKLAAEARLRELDLAERDGSLVPAAEVEARWTERVVALREALRSVPGMAVQAGFVRAADERKLEAMLRDALVAYARAVAAPPPDEEPKA